VTHRFGIVGAGMIAAVHAEAIRGLPGAELAGIMDRGSGKGARIAPGLDTTASDDLLRFVAREDVDVVTVASPSGAHMEAAVAAAEAGKHCIVEKPIEITLARVDAMIETHARAGTTLGGIFNTRYADAAQLVERSRRKGRFGRLTFGAALGPWWRDPSYYESSDWKGTWGLDGGGALMNQGIHSVDLLLWLMGSPVRSVSARTARLAHRGIEVEDTATACLEFENGALGTIASTTSMWPGHFRTVTLAGTDGTAVLADNNLLFWRFRDERPGDADVRERHRAIPGAGVGASDPAAGVTAEGHRAVFADFIAALDENRRPAIDGEEARKAVAIILAIYESARSGGAPVEVDRA